MGKITDLHELIWRNGHAKRYRSTPEQIEQNEREKRIQREIDELARKRAFGTSEDTEQPSPPEEPA